MTKVELQQQIEYLQEQNKALTDLLYALMTTGLGSEDEIQIQVLALNTVGLKAQGTIRYKGQDINADWSNHPIYLNAGDTLVMHSKVKEFKIVE